MMKVNTARHIVRAHIFRAAEKGQSESDFSNGCLMPPTIFMVGHADKLSVGFNFEKDQKLAHKMLVPCRKCKRCLLNRGKRWAAKAHTETVNSNRTWFVTLTVRPSDRFMAKVKAEHRLSIGGTVFRDLPPNEQFVEIHKELSPELTKWLKRVRKNARTTFRYMLVCEAHKDGFPHYHALIHEPKAAILKTVIEKAWKLGFSKSKLVDVKTSAPWYVAKYLTKSALTRVRASQRYGPNAQHELTARLLEATRTVLERGGTTTPVI